MLEGLRPERAGDEPLVIETFARSDQRGSNGSEDPMAGRSLK